MANRGSSWTNSDGLVVGYGTHDVMKTGATTAADTVGVKVSAVTFDYDDFNQGTTINAPVPAGARVLNVRVKIGTTWTSTGTNTFTVGDGSTANGFITTTVGTVANMTAGAILNMDGVYGFGATDTGASELKAYASADTIDVASAMTDWTAGTATLEVTYI